MDTQTTTHPRKRGGRPALPENERRCVRLQPGFTESEAAELEERAAALGLHDVTEWLRVASLGQTVKSVPAVNRQAYAELARLAGNINQLSARVNSGNIINGNSLAELLNQTCAQVKALRCELIGSAS